MQAARKGSVYRIRTFKLFEDNEQIEVVRGDKEMGVRKRQRQREIKRETHSERGPGNTF